MSPRSSSPKTKAKPKAKKAKAKGPVGDPDIYVGLLFVAVGSLALGCVFLLLELNAYQWTMPG